MRVVQFLVGRDMQSDKQFSITFVIFIFLKKKSRTRQIDKNYAAQLGLTFCVVCQPIESCVEPGSMICKMISKSVSGVSGLEAQVGERLTLHP